MGQNLDQFVTISSRYKLPDGQYSVAFSLCALSAFEQIIDVSDVFFIMVR